MLGNCCLETLGCCTSGRQSSRHNDAQENVVGRSWFLAASQTYAMSSHVDIPDDSQEYLIGCHDVIRENLNESAADAASMDHVKLQVVIKSAKKMSTQVKCSMD